MPTSFADIDLFKQFADPIMSRQSTASARTVNPYAVPHSFFDTLLRERPLVP
jgi:hypothetical protein